MVKFSLIFAAVAAVLLARHGVRNPTKPIAGYGFPSWYATPHSDGFLSKHGYELAQAMGRSYYGYFRRNGLVSTSCGPDRILAWADVEQRTYETARGMLSTIDGSGRCAESIALLHASAESDPLFHGEKKRETVAAAPGGAREQGAIAAVQQLVAHRCGASPCAPIRDLATASTLVENIALEYAQCRPVDAIAGAPASDFAGMLERAMRAHTLAYELHQRVPQRAIADGANLLAHIIGLLDDAVGRPHDFADVPEMRARRVALIVGHDGNIASLAGMLDAHWALGPGMVDDDTPPLGTLAFELFRKSKGTYAVGLQFISMSYDGMRRAAGERAKAHPVRFAGCTGSPCTVPLDELERLVSNAQIAAFVERQWPQSSVRALEFPAMEDPGWSTCVQRIR